MTVTSLRTARLSRDRDGDLVADSGDGEGSTRITHYHGDTVAQADLFVVDAPDPMTPADLADHIAACRAILDEVDPTRVNRTHTTSCDAALDASTERRAIAAVQSYSPATLREQVAAAESGVWPADADEVAVWRRALVLAGGEQ